MRTKESLKGEIRELMKDMAENGFELRRVERKGLFLRQNELLHARHEIMKSIAHRQGMVIEALECEAEYGVGRKVA